MNEFNAIEQQEHYKNLIIATFGELRDMMVDKNKNYGSSVFEDSIVHGIVYPKYDSLAARMGDKLKRVERQLAMTGEYREDDIKDIIGYYTALLIMIREDKEK
jgi:hypothetical protein